ncbi:MAG TPA: MltA domain-containing protein, partial [Syntrophales bacterium]|nr:MltA domain-containing protein [Syntrophales bacterium]
AYSFVIICAGMLVACSAPVERPVIPLPEPLALVNEEALPAFSDDLTVESLELAVTRSLKYYERLPEGRMFRIGPARYTTGEMKETLKLFLAILRSPEPRASKERRIAASFDIYRASGSGIKGAVLFTGYYEPVLKASMVETAQYRYPIYRAPKDLLFINLEKFRERYKGERLVARIGKGEIVPYYSREEIDGEGALKGRGLEIAWFADPVDIFFLHIQGSGKVCPVDGNCFQVSYALANGRPYRSIGKYLMEQGKVPPGGMSAQAIKEHLRENPDELSEILNYNESYVFFRTVKEGPVGSLDIPVTAGRSIATDQTLFPRGALAFIRTRKPLVDNRGQVSAWTSFSRFVLNQDTGGAIVGPGRVDLFFGTGSEAGAVAGYMKEEGELYFLVMKKKFP